MDVIVLAVAGLGIVLTVIGSGLGAYLGKVPIWKGPIVMYSGSIARALVVEILPPTPGLGSFSWVISLSVSALVAWHLDVPLKAFVFIVIGTILAAVLYLALLGYIYPATGSTLPR